MSATPEAAKGEDLRPLVAELRERLNSGTQTQRAAFEAHGRVRPLLHARARLVDGVLRELWRRLGVPRGVALVAVGGYGRRELFPHSDVDLLMLIPEADDPSSTAKLESFIGLAWDVGLEIGHSSRTIAECLEQAAREITIETSLLEARYLCGSRKSFTEFSVALRGARNPQHFLNAKRLEQEERYGRFNDTPYSLEPNCKESPGGLRDLQVILWIARASGIGSGWTDLAREGLITRREALAARRLEDFMGLVRARLHFISGRREDRLVFDHQEALARAFGIEATETKRASEVLMQRYYRGAKRVTQLNTILLQNLAGRIAPRSAHAAIRINARFQTERELLDVVDESVFERYPHAIFESFLLLQQRAELKGMTARTLRALWRARSLITPAFRRDPASRAMFLSILRQRRGVVHELRRMNQWGILGAYLPAFGHIVGQMQHDLFHVYTVDQHILQVVRNVRRFTMAEHAHEYPLCSRLIAGFDRHWLIYVAALFHDIAKGRGGDHSELGSRDARRFCREHGLSAEDTELIVFLVEHHLTMSSVAQKQDLTDIEVLRRFAELVGNERRLVALYLLTHADIRGTSPKVWNNWKGKLLVDLLEATQGLLRGATPQQALGIAERQEAARAQLRFHGLRADVETELWNELDTVYFLRHDAEEIAWHARLLYYRPSAPKPVVKARLNQIGEGLQVVVYSRDEPWLFARLCAFFARLGFSIADAKIHTTRHGYALDSFVLLAPEHDISYRDTISLIEHDLIDRLATHAPLDQPGRARIPRQVRHFPVTPEVSIRPDERGNHHILSIMAADRPGLLFAIAQALARHTIEVHAAKIATLGDRVEDTFLISGRELSKTSTLLRVEQELLDALQV